MHKSYKMLAKSDAYFLRCISKYSVKEELKKEAKL